MSQTESGATSPAQAQAANSGDGKAKTAANVTAAEAVLRFVKASEQQAEAATQTTDTPATPPQEAAEESPAVESAQPDSPEAAPETPAEGAPEAAEEAAPTTTEGEGETEGEADEALSHESQTLDAKTKERIQRRIDKEVGKRKALEAQLQQVQSQLQELASKPQPTQEVLPLPTDTPAPLPTVKTPAELDAYRKEIKTAARNIEALLDRDDIDQGVQWGDKTWTKAELKALMRDARVTLEDTIPEQEKFFQKQNQFAQARQQLHKQAVADWPFLADPTSAEYKQAQQFKKEAGWLNSLAYGDWVAGAMVVAANTLKARKEAGNAKGKDESTNKATKPPVVIPKPKPPASQTVTSTAGGVPRNDPNQGRAVPKAEGNQTAESTAKLLEARERARRAR